jgi:hypothetical protein
MEWTKGARKGRGPPKISHVKFLLTAPSCTEKARQCRLYSWWSVPEKRHVSWKREGILEKTPLNHCYSVHASNAALLCSRQEQSLLLNESSFGTLAATSLAHTLMWFSSMVSLLIPTSGNLMLNVHFCYQISIYFYEGLHLYAYSAMLWEASVTL